MKLAVIDLGTNTFHILIVETGPGQSFTEIFRERRFVQLAEDGIKKIGAAPFQRGVETLIHFKKVLDAYEVKKVKAFGTAALRTATNSVEFIKKIKSETGIHVERISGGDEALLITEGVRMAVPINNDPALIMDIGGGSVEFILANHSEVFWAESFPIGVAVLFNSFHHSEPISSQETESLWTHLEEVLKSFQIAIAKTKPQVLIGASGTFDVLNDLLADENRTKTWGIVPSEKFYPLCEKLVNSDLEARLSMEDIPEQRAKLIVVAIILIKYILSINDIKEIWISSYALKEGMISEMRQTII